MVGLIIDHHDILLVAEITAHATDHPGRRFSEGAWPFLRQDTLREPAGIVSLPEFEGMKISDDDLGRSHLRPQIRGNNIHLLVVILGVARQEDPQSIADGNTGRHNEKGIRETGILPVGMFV